jgi:hypothetical protein
LVADPEFTIDAAPQMPVDIGALSLAALDRRIVRVAANKRNS